MNTAKPIDGLQARKIGYAIGEPLIMLGHPLTCNGGNLDYATHHDHEVLMLLNSDGLLCPECGRVQVVPAYTELPDGWAW